MLNNLKTLSDEELFTLMNYCPGRSGAAQDVLIERGYESLKSDVEDGEQ